MYIGHRREPAYRLPEQLVEDTKLTPYAKQLALILFSLADQSTGEVRNDQRRLAALSGMSLSTVSRRLRELEKAGYITTKKERAHFDWDKGRLTRKADTYICHIPETGYLLIPYRLLRRLCSLGIHGAPVAVFIYVYRMMRLEELRRQSHKKEPRAYPSFSMIAEKTGRADSTVRAALKVLEAVGLLYIERCLKRNGAYSCNSYRLLHDTLARLRPTWLCVARSAAQHLRSGGRRSAGIENNKNKSKITRVLTREERTIQRGDFPKISSVQKPQGGVRSAPPYRTMPNFFTRESRSGERGDPPQRGERGEVTFSVSRPGRPALFGSPLSLLCPGLAIYADSI
ncbi:helix-turn-helix domain-containing protein [Oscillibacter valericigenes]|nr:helix-turn-helix domain-containing protein [Oscillibacter valericigenes]